MLSRKLEPSVSLPVYSSHAAALSGGAAAGEAFLAGGERCVLWLGPPPEDKLPKDAAGIGSRPLLRLMLQPSAQLARRVWLLALPGKRSAPAPWPLPNQF